MSEVVATTSAGAAVGAADGEVCDPGVRRAFEFLGKRWNGVILGALSQGSTGFADLRRAVGSITDSVLSDRLTELGRAGLVERTVADGRPPSVQYALSENGRALLPILDALGRWAMTNLPEAECRAAGHRV